ncbi:LuxR C-terminal-related transcriptional regulator [Variovorax sp. RA8]|uniref:LuxR C-terminal-related transcriptional regulator n=1 Tax=Variovorax sp. (strain JCM 16519 / RA8) TaxID=662548 RepID=UPI000AE8DBF1|nr:response regulator transcription factor [Variovorax sp. RA8]VTU16412.1 Response regulator protein VraR [Variovorax sp. RA8]
MPIPYHAIDTTPAFHISDRLPPAGPARLDTVVIGTTSPALRFGLEGLIGTLPELHLAGSASTLPELAQACSRAGPCLALTDGLAADGSVAQLIHRLASHARLVRIVLITDGCRTVTVREAFKSGVLGFVRPSDGIDEIRSALQRVATGQRHIPGDIATHLAESLELEDLTSREMQVLDLLSLGRCNKSIANELDVAVGTVKTHVRAIMCKLDAPSRMAAILEANRLGLIRIA